MYVGLLYIVSGVTTHRGPAAQLWLRGPLVRFVQVNASRKLCPPSAGAAGAAARSLLIEYIVAISL